ncbi:MAG: Hsp20/alpha crystallin family protein [Holophaga sp.]|nr:Hsp20/alpha crystallin family protein [Holophaga sp.]
MNLIRTRESRAIPVQSNVLEPFRLMRNFLRWDPYRDFSFPEDAAGTFMPSFDVKETSDAYVFTADMPGIRKEDLDIQLTGNRLTISGRREAEGSSDDGQIYSQERSFGTFSRSFSLPEEVESGKVAAELRDGVLHLMVPKSPEVRPQKITVS